MEKKELRWYETPAVEVVEMEVSTPLLETSGTPWDPDEPADDF